MTKKKEQDEDTIMDEDSPQEEECEAEREEDERSTEPEPPAVFAVTEEGQQDQYEGFRVVCVEDGCLTIRINAVLGVMLTVVAVMMGVAGFFLVMIVRGLPMDVDKLMQEARHRAGEDAVHVFRALDLNQDHQLSVMEYTSLVRHIKDVESLASKIKLAETFPRYEPQEGEEVLVVHAKLSPLRLRPVVTWSDFFTTSFSDLGFKLMQLYIRTARFYVMPYLTGQNTLHGVDTWAEPNVKHEVFGASEFQALLPEDMDDLEVGLPYRVLHYDSLTSDDPITDPYVKLNSRKYIPSMPQNARERLLFRLLAMMHPRPFVQMRFHPRGTVACVRAVNDRYVHIVFRMHAEFQLSETPANPFWFSPAQFLGDLVISRDGSHVHYFNMHVPNDRKLNVDMEWIMDAVEGYEAMEVDIGYLPLMEWSMGGDSHVPLPGQSIRPDTELPAATTPSSLEWTQQTTREDALRAIEADFYEFKRVTYHNLTDAVRLSRKELRPLHAIFLWGALDDQSC